jgi:hypothetical protein
MGRLEAYSFSGDEKASEGRPSSSRARFSSCERPLICLMGVLDCKGFCRGVGGIVAAKKSGGFGGTYRGLGGVGDFGGGLGFL